MSKISKLYMLETEKEGNQDDEIIRQEIRQFFEKNGISISAEKKTGKSGEDLVLESGRINHSESDRNSQFELNRNSQCTLAN